MRWFLIIALSLITLNVGLTLGGCTQVFDKYPPAKYRFGDKVYVQSGFFKGCKGRVTRATYINFGSNPYYAYGVDTTCTSDDGKFTQTKQIDFEEEDLVEDAS